MTADKFFQGFAIMCGAVFAAWFVAGVFRVIAAVIY